MPAGSPGRCCPWMEASRPMHPLEYVAAHRAEIIDELIAFARIPSVSTDPAYAAHIAAGAEWVAERMRRAGLEHVQVNPTEGHPIVTGRDVRGIRGISADARDPRECD